MNKFIFPIAAVFILAVVLFGSGALYVVDENRAGRYNAFW